MHKNKPPAIIRKYLGIKKKASRELRDTNKILSQKKMERLMTKISRAEKGIQAYYQGKTEEEEMRAWSRMEVSNKYFFKYAKSKMCYKSPIGRAD